MSETITPNFVLTFQPGTNPVHYGVTILINDQGSSNPQVDLQNNGEMNSELTTYTTTVDMINVDDDPVILKVDLGQLEIHPEDGEVDITLVDGATHVGHARIKVKEAQDESRPIPSKT